MKLHQDRHILRGSYTEFVLPDFPSVCVNQSPSGIHNLPITMQKFQIIRWQMNAQSELIYFEAEIVSHIHSKRPMHFNAK